MNERIEMIECTIALRKDLSYAKHSYKYTLRNFGDEAGENSFYFVVPNAAANQIHHVMAYDGDTDHQPAMSKQPQARGTKLVFSNLSPVLPGQLKVFTFSYEAPTSAFTYKSVFGDVAFYRAELVHSYDTDKALVTLELPKGSRITDHVGNAKRAGSCSITFEENDLDRDRLYAFPIFFYRRRVLAAIGLFAVTALIGAFFEEVLKGLFDWINGWL